MKPLRTNEEKIYASVATLKETRKGGRVKMVANQPPRMTQNDKSRRGRAQHLKREKFLHAYFQ